jgi:histone H3
MPANTEVRSMGGKSIARGFGKGKQVRSSGKHISRKAPLHTSLASKKALTSLTPGVKKPRRFRPGTIALREIRKYQSSTEPLIPKASFNRALKSVSNELASGTAFPNGLRTQAAAGELLHIACEAYLIKSHGNANMLAIHSKRITVTAKDLQMARRISGECP